MENTIGNFFPCLLQDFHFSFTAVVVLFIWKFLCNFTARQRTFCEFQKVNDCCHSGHSIPSTCRLGAKTSWSPLNLWSWHILLSWLLIAALSHVTHDCLIPPLVSYNLCADLFVLRSKSRRTASHNLISFWRRKSQGKTSPRTIHFLLGRNL